MVALDDRMLVFSLLKTKSETVAQKEDGQYWVISRWFNSIEKPWSQVSNLQQPLPLIDRKRETGVRSGVWVLAFPEYALGEALHSLQKKPQKVVSCFVPSRLASCRFGWSNIQIEALEIQISPGDRPLWLMKPWGLPTEQKKITWHMDCCATNWPGSSGFPQSLPESTNPADQAVLLNQLDKARWEDPALYRLNILNPIPYMRLV